MGSGKGQVKRVNAITLTKKQKEKARIKKEENILMKAKSSPLAEKIGKGHTIYNDQVNDFLRTYKSRPFNIICAEANNRVKISDPLVLDRMRSVNFNNCMVENVTYGYINTYGGQYIPDNIFMKDAKIKKACLAVNETSSSMSDRRIMDSISVNNSEIEYLNVSFAQINTVDIKNTVIEEANFEGTTFRTGVMKNVTIKRSLNPFKIADEVKMKNVSIVNEEGVLVKIKEGQTYNEALKYGNNTEQEEKINPIDDLTEEEIQLIMEKRKAKKEAEEQENHINF